MKEKRVSATLNGDEAISLEIMVTSMQMEGNTKEINQKVVTMGIMALELKIKEYCEENGIKHPSEAQIKEFLNNG